jgi:hypothetical protein
VTTPPTPAGWYPDPDGSGGQRYWDGSAWTEHRAPATPEPAAPAAPAEPEVPGSEQPTTVVPLRPADEHVGAHRAPESTPEPEPEATPEPEPGPTAVINLDSVPSVPSEQATAVIRTTPPVEPTPPADPTRPAEPSFASAPLPPPPSGEPGEPPTADAARRKLIIGFGAACAALLAVLVVVVIYGLFFNMSNNTQASSGPSSTAKSAAPTTSSGNGWGSSTETPSESPRAPSGSGPQASDGGLTFAITGVETASTVQYQDAPVEKKAQGEFLIVHMNVLNSSAAQGTFLATLQKLKAGGTTYSIDDEATAYLNGTWADLNPSDSADLAIAFDVPPGTSGESLEVHGAPMSAGVDVPLS